LRIDRSVAPRRRALGISALDEFRMRFGRCRVALPPPTPSRGPACPLRVRPSAARFFVLCAKLIETTVVKPMRAGRNRYGIGRAPGRGNAAGSRYLKAAARRIRR